LRKADRSAPGRAGCFRRALWLVAVALTALTLAACGDDDDGDGGSGGGGGATSGQAAELDLHTDGQLTIGAEFPVKGFVELPIDDPKGFEVDLADAIAKELGVPKVQWKNTPFSGLFSPAPKDFDMAINEISITDERSKVVDFSAPYFEANQGFLIKKGSPADGVQSIEEMKGLRFGVQATTTGADYVKETIQPDEEPREFSTLGAATQALVNGQVDAFVMDVAIGAEIIKERGEDVDMTGQFKTDEQYGILFEKGNPLRQQVNEALREIKADGTLERLQAKWFPGTEDLPSLQ
jgi:polar amino acid transport system substrate-binding protein